MPVDYQRNQLLFRRLSRALGQVSKHPRPDAVHQFRTTARRIESLLDALAASPDPDARKLLKRVGRIRRRAGRLRDVDVQMAALRTLKLGRETERKQRLAKFLENQRARREKKLLAALDPDTIRKLRKRMRRVALAVAAPPTTNGAKPAPALEPVPEALRRFAAFVRSHGALTEATLHQYRMDGKRIRYMAEMAGDDPVGKQVVHELKRMQDSIGDWHDWFALTQTAQEVFAPASECPLLSALRNITRAKFNQAVRVATEVKRNLLSIHRSLAAQRRRPAPAPAAPGTTAATA